MCLMLNVRKSKWQLDFEKKLNKYGKVVCYKKYKRIGKYLESEYRNFRVRRPGFIFSDRQFNMLEENEIYTRNVYHGIHVYIKKKDIKNININGYKIVPVVCCSKDFVSTGMFCSGKNAVFMKVKITKPSFQKAIRKV